MLMDAMQKTYIKSVESGRLCGDHLRVSLLGSGFGANISVSSTKNPGNLWETVWGHEPGRTCGYGEKSLL